MVVISMILYREAGISLQYMNLREIERQIVLPQGVEVRMVFKLYQGETPRINVLIEEL
jgi:hypothetical protein